MLQIFYRGGALMWPLLLILICIIIFSIKKAIDIYTGKNLDRVHSSSSLNTILFWGLISIVIGFLAHFWGLYMAMMSITHADDISPTIVAEGMAVSLITIIFGLLIFLISGIVWLFLRWQLNQKLQT